MSKFSPVEVLATFPIEVCFPQASAGAVADVREAIGLEYCDSIRVKRLNCRGVTQSSLMDSGGIFELQTGQAVDFDWTWEGAAAFRPRDPDSYEKSSSSNGDVRGDSTGEVVWAGEVVEVDEASGKIFVKVDGDQSPPTTGSFFVRPFEFLSVLHSIYHSADCRVLQEMLPGRLQAACGGVHPRTLSASSAGLPQFNNWWQHQWSVLWGPPGTGKTHTIGQQLAEVLSDPGERVLVVSTTNSATDSSAVAIGRAAHLRIPDVLNAGRLLRIGKGASLKRFARERLNSMLRGTETDFLNQIESLTSQLSTKLTASEKARIRAELSDLRKSMRDAGTRRFLDPDVSLIVATAFRATSLILLPQVVEMLLSGKTPFTTVVIDEAGLISRAAVAVLSLLASRRVVLVGDARQLAPISRMCRLLPPAQMKWLSSSGLSHLQSLDSSEAGVHVLKCQYRMHPDVCRVVSGFQYDGLLQTAVQRQTSVPPVPPIVASQPRAIWYVLDQSGLETKSIRADRGPGNKSWTREGTLAVLKSLFADPEMQRSNGLFITPFRAQATEVAVFLTSNRCLTWSSATVHSCQGAEADIVIFDTVNAGSYGWPSAEWKRLVNVAISRARECLILIASCSEMEEPYLRPLKPLLSPRILLKRGRNWEWTTPGLEEPDLEVESEPLFPNPGCLGAQLHSRQLQRPVLSYEQQRLCGLRMDGKPRLVRGVAGSGKTVVLAHWMMQTIRRTWHQENYTIWAVFGNRSLEGLIRRCIDSAWDKESGGRDFPWCRVELVHINDLLQQLLRQARLPADINFDYDRGAASLLSAMSGKGITPRCDALFVDEAQDMGPQTIRLLHELVRPSEADANGGRAINIFYDNAQDIYGRGTPAWTTLGINIRGRSTIMKEGFRSTRAISEVALNVLFALRPPDENPDHVEMLSLGLIEPVQRGGAAWWNVCFNQIDGPCPELRVSRSLELEMVAISDYIEFLIQRECVRPSDICIIYNSALVRNRIERQLSRRMRSIGVDLSLQANRNFQRADNTLIATTANSFKGFDAEVVIIPAVDQFVAASVGVLANSLYVAMTRARSILTMFTHAEVRGLGREVVEAITSCLKNIKDPPTTKECRLDQREFEDLLIQIGHSHREWLGRISKRFAVAQEPIFLRSGEVLAEPIFWVEADGVRWACFGNRQVTARDAAALQSAGVKFLTAGDLPRELFAG